MNYNTTMSSSNSLPCTKKEFKHIKQLLEKGSQTPNPHGIDCEYDGKEIYLFGEECACPEALTQEVLDAIAKLVKRAGKKYLEFQLGFNSSRPCPDSQGGIYARLLTNGDLIWPKLVWPPEAQ